MAKRRRMGKKERDDAWNALPESDRRCISALIIISRVLRDENIRYREPSASLRRSLHKLNRNTLYGVIAECLYVLLDAPVIERVKKVHRQRDAKKRLSAAKKKSRAKKKPAPKRRKRKGPSK